MKGSKEHDAWVRVDVEHLEMLYDTIEKQRGQLSLAFSVLVGLGFDLVEFAEAA